MKRIAHILNGYIVNVSLAKDDHVLPDDGSKMLEVDALAAGLAWLPIENIKIWPNVQQFIAEFTMDEKAAVSMSTDPTIAALRLELSTWFSEVHANDPRVVMGLEKMVELGMITTERKTQIITLQP